MSEDNISVATLAKSIEANEDFFLLDVRSLEEHQQYHIGGHLIPLPELTARLQEIPTSKPIVVYCRSGYRSQVAQGILQQTGFKEVKNLIGGILAWQHQVLDTQSV